MTLGGVEHSTARVVSLREEPEEPEGPGLPHSRPGDVTSRRVEAARAGHRPGARSTGGGGVIVDGGTADTCFASALSPGPAEEAVRRSVQPNAGRSEPCRDRRHADDRHRHAGVPGLRRRGGRDGRRPRQGAELRRGGFRREVRREGHRHSDTGIALHGVRQRHRKVCREVLHGGELRERPGSQCDDGPRHILRHGPGAGRIR
mmetsp:Transcript_4928/g.11062  ORF Transcript_4928/g.11062 Transcript_4928/m.11062 type:complete len:203 (-) Transcript_4928:732-1340(-)